MAPSQKNFLKALRPRPEIILSATLTVFAFPPWDLSFLIWFALVPWFWLLDRLAEEKDWKSALIQGIWYSSLMTLGGLYWVAYAAHQFGELPWPIAILVLIAFSLGNQATFPIFGVLYSRMGKFYNKKSKGRAGFYRHALFILGLAFLYAGMDGILPRLFMDTMGHALFNAEFLRQAADIGGAYFLTFFIVAVNLSLALTLRRFFFRKEPSIWPVLKSNRAALAIVAGCFLFLFSYGSFRYHQVRDHYQNSTRWVRGAAVQGNIGDFEKVAAETGSYHAGEKIIQTYFRISRVALKHRGFGFQPPEFLIWPETAYPSNFRTPMNTVELSRDQKVEAFVKETEVPLLFGGYDHADRKDFNSLFMLSPEPLPNADPNQKNADLQIYHKGVLLPFGEYIPGFDENSIFKDLFQQMGFFGIGPGPTAYDVPLKSGNLRIAPVICYEALIPSYVFPTARAGANVILNITNDSWFGIYGEPYLHLALTVFRSIETRLPQIRATNTGISAMILPTGDFATQTPIGKERVMNVAVPMAPRLNTVIVSLGDWFPMFSLIIGLIAALWIRKQLQSVRGR